MIQPIIRDNSFNGKYVAIKSFDDHLIVGDGQTPQEAYDKALKKGCKEPVITFVPLKNVVQIY